MNTTVRGQIELADQLNQLLRDCNPVLRDALFFEQIEDTAQLVWRNERGDIFNESLSITKTAQTGNGFMLFKPYCVERAVLVPGVRYTRNGDGWPDDVDITELGLFDTPRQAFNFLIVEWFREQIARCLESAAETRMLEEQEKIDLSEHATNSYSASGVSTEKDL